MWTYKIDHHPRDGFVLCISEDGGDMRPLIRTSTEAEAQRWIEHMTDIEARKAPRPRVPSIE
jgi:hypothetical protein